MHDWTRVTAGMFHDFYHGWIAEPRRALNDGLLPPECYAMVEQVAGRTVPDVLTLQNLRGPLADQGYDVDPHARPALGEDGGGGGILIADAPPRTLTVESVSEATRRTTGSSR